MSNQNLKVEKTVRNLKIVLMRSLKIGTRTLHGIRKRRKIETGTETDLMTRRVRSHVTRSVRSHMTRSVRSLVTRSEKDIMIRTGHEIVGSVISHKTKVESEMVTATIKIANIVR